MAVVHRNHRLRRVKPLCEWRSAREGPVVHLSGPPCPAAADHAQTCRQPGGLPPTGPARPHPPKPAARARRAARQPDAIHWRRQAQPAPPRGAVARAFSVERRRPSEPERGSQRPGAATTRTRLQQANTTYGSRPGVHRWPGESPTSFPAPPTTAYVVRRPAQFREWQHKTTRLGPRGTADHSCYLRTYMPIKELRSAGGIPGAQSPTQEGVVYTTNRAELDDFHIDSIADTPPGPLEAQARPRRLASPGTAVRTTSSTASYAIGQQRRDKPKSWPDHNAIAGTTRPTTSERSSVCGCSGGGKFWRVNERCTSPTVRDNGQRRDLGGTPTTPASTWRGVHTSRATTKSASFPELSTTRLIAVQTFYRQRRGNGTDGDAPPPRLPTSSPIYLRFTATTAA